MIERYYGLEDILGSAYRVSIILCAFVLIYTACIAMIYALIILQAYIGVENLVGSYLCQCSR